MLCCLDGEYVVSSDDNYCFVMSRLLTGGALQNC